MPNLFKISVKNESGGAITTLPDMNYARINLSSAQAVREAAERLEAGNVWVNSLHIGFDEMPFGGVKESGLGREHGPEALDYYLEPKGVVIATG